MLQGLEAQERAFEAGGAELYTDESFDIIRGDCLYVGNGFADTQLGEHRCCCLADNAAGAVKAQVG